MSGGPSGRNLTAWALTTGEAGMRSQAKGLAAAVAEEVLERTAPRSGPRAWLARLFGVGRLPPEWGPPWPDLVVSCGRRAAPFARAIKAASGGRTLAVHVQDPRVFRGAFDLIVAMDHDRLVAGPRVMKIATALHDVTQERLQAAAAAWAPRMEALGRPLLGVAVGGDLRGRPFGLDDAARLVAALRRRRDELGGGLAITPSRRTPLRVRQALIDSFADDASAYVWDLAGDNPYAGILALADRLVVTTDSVSMVSEAIATGRPVELFDLSFARHRGFIQSLVDQGLAVRLGDPSGGRPSVASDPTAQAAARVRGLIQMRMGFSG